MTRICRLVMVVNVTTGKARLERVQQYDLGRDPSWSQRPPRRQSLRPLVPTGRVDALLGRGVRRRREDAEWDD